MTDTSHGVWDAIVIGSGIGGMAAGAALSRVGHKVLLLEQHQTLGGLTHSFSRDGFTWDVGMHYLGGMSPQDQDRAVAVRFTDRLRFLGLDLRHLAHRFVRAALTVSPL